MGTRLEMILHDTLQRNSAQPWTWPLCTACPPN